MPFCSLWLRTYVGTRALSLLECIKNGICVRSWQTWEVVLGFCWRRSLGDDGSFYTSEERQRWRVQFFPQNDFHGVMCAHDSAMCAHDSAREIMLTGKLCFTSVLCIILFILWSHLLFVVMLWTWMVWDWCGIWTTSLMSQQCCFLCVHSASSVMFLCVSPAVGWGFALCQS